MDVATQALGRLSEMSLTQAASTINVITSLIDVPPAEDPNEDGNSDTGSEEDPNEVSKTSSFLFYIIICIFEWIYMHFLLFK